VKETSPEAKAEVIAALLAGQGVRETARKYNISRSTVSRLRNSLSQQELGQIETEKRERISDLVESHLTESLKAAASLAKKVTNDAWFSKQNAADIGVLYGILTDKAVRILEAAELAAGEGATDSSLVH
jgi:hypothetical protein